MLTQAVSAAKKDGHTFCCLPLECLCDGPRTLPAIALKILPSRKPPNLGQIKGLVTLLASLLLKVSFHRQSFFNLTVPNYQLFLKSSAFMSPVKKSFFGQVFTQRPNFNREIMKTFDEKLFKWISCAYNVLCILT